MSADRLIMGLAGQPGSGKSSCARHLEAQGFALFYPPDRIRQYAAAHERPIRSRRELGALAFDEMPLTLGVDWRIDMLNRMPDRLIVFDGVRTMRDYRLLLGMGSFVVALDCAAAVSNERLFARNDVRKDDMSMDEMLEIIRAESYNADPTRSSTQEVVDNVPAEWRIDANRPLEEVLPDLDALVSRAAILRSTGTA